MTTLFRRFLQPDPTVFKRYRMEVSLSQPVSVAPVPQGYECHPWSPELLRAHALAQWHAFTGEPDAVLFPNLGSRSGCLLLLHAIQDSPLFFPDACWLITWQGQPVAAIQGLLEPTIHYGSIQNVGVHPEHRGRGLGRALLQHALQGYRLAGALRVDLEVTAKNHAAVGLYRDLGFRIIRTKVRTARQPVENSEPAHT